MAGLGRLVSPSDKAPPESCGCKLASARVLHRMRLIGPPPKRLGVRGHLFEKTMIGAGRASGGGLVTNMYQGWWYPGGCHFPRSTSFSSCQPEALCSLSDLQRPCHIHAPPPRDASCECLSECLPDICGNGQRFSSPGGSLGPGEVCVCGSG